MKIPTLITASLIAVAPAMAISDNDHTTQVIGTRVEKTLSLDERALNSCVQQFISKILPGSPVQVQTVYPTRGQTVFHSGYADPLYKKRMTVEMNASTRNGSLLATASCKVTRNARVASIKTEISDADALAGFTVKDLRLIASIR